MESSDDRNPVEALAEEFMERKRQGENLALEEYTDKYPQWADEIRELFPAMELMEDFKPASEDLSQASADSRQPHSMPHLDQVGDYRILREVGRGGMGVVYEAEQQSLGRRVALKVLPRQMAGDGRSLARFQREARAAARMHHTNIVPVFEVGSADEFVFYAMQLINGQGLDQVIDDLRRLRATTPRSTLRSGSRRSAPQAESSVRPQPLSIAESLSMGHFRPEPLDEQGRAEALKASRQTNPPKPQEDDFAETITLQADSTNSAALPGKKDLSTAESNRKSYYLSVAEIGSQTASALSYAHARGIIHRDIKPSNLLLDGAGTVWVVDFGLAKTGDAAMTHTGDLLGTLRYMSPERFGGMCDVRADIYSLGLTLYELLLLEPAFHAPDQLKLIDQIKQTDPKPLRSVDARIPRDLETVVLKAIDKDPRRRYQSADELADDLARFVQDEPIQARRVSAVERVARWSRRNRALAASVATVATLLIVIAIGALLAAGHFRYLQQEATESANQMAALAEEKTQLADANERLALDKELEAENAQAQKQEAVAARQVAVEAQVELRQELYISDMREVRQAYHDGAPARVDALLRKYVPRPGQADLRSWEWFYWRRTNRRHLHQIFVGPPVYELAISPDRTWFAIQLWTGVVHVYDAQSRRRIARLESGTTHELCQSLAISSDGRTLAAVGDGKVKLWNTDEWFESAVLKPQGNPWAIAFSIDGRLAIAERPGAVTFWDIDSGQPNGPPLKTGQLLSCLAFSPDGRRLATANSTADENQAPGLLIWELDTLALDSQLVGPHHYLLALAWKEDHQRSVMAAGFANGYVRSWDGSNYEERDARSVGAPVVSLAFSPNGSRLAAGTSRGNSLHVWETDSRRSVTSMQGHSQGVWGVGFVNEATVWSGASDGSMKAWDVKRGSSFSRLAGTSSRIGSGIYPFVVFGADDKTLWRREPGGAIHRWRYRTGETLPLFREKENRRMAFSEDGRFLLLVERETELENKFQVWRLDDEEPTLVRERFVPDQTGNRLVDHATISDDGSVVVWVYGTELFRLKLDTGDLVQWTEQWPPVFTRLSPTGRFLAVTRQTNNWDLRVWDVGDAPKLHAPVPGTGPIFETEFSPDGSTLALSRWENGVVQLFDLATKEASELRGHAGAVHTIEFSPDGSLLVSGGADGILRLWNLKQRSLLTALSPHDLPIISVAFSHDGHTIASVGEDGDTRLWWGGDEQSQDADYWRWIADTHEQRDSREAALAAWSQAIQLSPQPVSSDFLRRGEVQLEQERFAKAATDFATAWRNTRSGDRGRASDRFGRFAKTFAKWSPLETTEAQGARWRFTLSEPPANWQDPDFDDSHWQSAGPRFETGAPYRWPSRQIWIRREVQQESPATKPLTLYAYIDDQATVFLNGKATATAAWVGARYQFISCRDSLQPGRNVVAVHCKDGYGSGAVHVILGKDEPSDQVVDLFSRAIESDPQNDALLKHRANIFEALGQTDAANKDHLAAVRIRRAQPGWANETNFDTADSVYLQRLAGDPHLFEALQRELSDDGMLWLARGRALAVRSDWQAAADAFARYREVPSEAACNIWFERACLLLMNGAKKEYRELLDRLHKSAGETPSGRLAFVLARTTALTPTDPAHASLSIAWARHAVKQHGRAWSTHVLGLAYLRAGDYDVAEERLEESLSANWSNGQNRLALAILHHHRGDDAEAQRFLTAALRWSDNQVQNAVDGAVKMPALDWLAFHVLLREAESLIAP